MSDATAPYIEPPAQGQDPNPPTDQTTHPDMQEFKQLPWPEDASSWASEAATGINDQMQRERIAANNAAATQAYSNGINRFANGLIKWASDDPTRAEAAIREVRPYFDHLIGLNPSIPDEDRGAHHEALSSDLEGQIAQAAVKSMAEMHAPTARSMLDNLGGYLGDDQKDYLGAYIGAQDFARGVDAAGQQQMQARLADQRSAMAATGHAAQLYDPASDTLRFPPGWAQSLTANPAISYPDKAVLLHLNGRMQSSGDAPVSDPTLINNTLQQIARGNSPDHRELLNAAGTSLRLADALHLATGSGPLSVTQRNSYGYLADTVQQARDALYGRDGENGAAGHAAWGRYVNWLMPAVRGGMGFGDPDTHPLNMLGQFRPTGNDVAPTAPAEGRKSLAEIFGR